MTKLLAIRIEEQITEYIRSKPVPVGTKLPNEYEMGKQFQAGRSTIREAVKSLVSKGILEVRRGDGTYVINTASRDEDPLGLKKIKDKIALALDLAEVRMMLEPGIAEMAALRRDAAGVRQLEEICSRIEARIKKGESYAREDIELHTWLARCSGNRVVEQLIPVINQAVTVFVDVTDERLKDETIKTHRRIIEAVAERDPVGARTAMIMHLAYNRDMIKDLGKNS